jgi:hypothetical protein
MGIPTFFVALGFVCGGRGREYKREQVFSGFYTGPRNIDHKRLLIHHHHR